MHWQTAFDDKQRKMLLEKHEDGWPVPVLDDAVLPPISLAWAYSAFHELQTCRPVGMGLAPIPITEMRRYFDTLGIGAEAWPEAKAYWRALDQATLEHYRKQLPKRPESSSGDSRSGQQVVARADFPEG